MLLRSPKVFMIWYKKKSGVGGLKQGVKFLLSGPCRVLLVIHPPWKKAEIPCSPRHLFKVSYAHVTLPGSL